MKKTIVLGGGTAGWLTALLVREFYPQFAITLVESDAIGILGAGEGTVPHIKAVLDFLRIPVSSLFRECSATLKTGIKFNNWNGDGNSYFHNFAANDELEMWSLNVLFRYNMLPTLMVAEDRPLDSAGFVAKLHAMDKVPFIRAIMSEHEREGSTEPLMTLHEIGSFALHFDARLLAGFLQKLAVGERNIRRVEGKLDQVLGEAGGDITGLTLENGNVLECDFIFDCSGFARLLLGKHYGEPWIDYSRHLPLDTALPFFIPHDGNKIPAYTEAIALKYGWMWKIPVQERYGCGYVFDSTFISEEEAIAEVEELLGFEVTSPKTFRFKAGAFHNTLVRNCFAVGLSQNFVEPLEATSIWVFTKNLINFLRADAINNLDEGVVNAVNAACRKVNDPIPEFLQLHYLTRRDDSPFWRTFRERMTLIPSLQEKLQLWRNIPLFDPDAVHLEMFKAPSWLAVGAGIGIFDSKTFQRISGSFDLAQNLDAAWGLLQKRQEYAARACITHGEFISLMRSR